MKNLDKIEKLIGNTPLVKINYKYKNKKSFLYAKLEWFNVSGSIKDRPAFEIIKQAYKKGELKQGQTICETTSGNMGIAICAIANLTHNPVVICMPKTMSKERQDLLKMYGAKLELTESFDEAFEKAQEYKHKGAFLTMQFENEDNKLAHHKTTAKEICAKLKNIPAFVSGVGTGGTLIGIGGYLKKHKKTKVIAIDPQESSMLLTGKSHGMHKIQGLSDGLIPKLYDKTIVDKVISIKSNDAICLAQKICKELGLGVGISSGANFLGCVLSKVKGSVTVFADDNKKYLTTDLSYELKSNLADEIELIDYELI